MENTKFFCEDCQQTFKSKQNLHYKTEKHKNKGVKKIYSCNECNWGLDNNDKAAYESHLLTKRHINTCTKTVELMDRINKLRNKREILRKLYKHSVKRWIRNYHRYRRAKQNAIGKLFNFKPLQFADWELPTTVINETITCEESTYLKH